MHLMELSLDTWVLALSGLLTGTLFVGAIRLIVYALSTKGDDFEPWYGKKQ